MVILRTLSMSSHTFSLFLPVVFFLVLAFAVSCPLSASEPGSVLILGSDCSGGICTVDSYGSGFIVKIDEARNAAYVLTARGVVRESDRLYVLYDPVTYPFELVFDLEEGTIPSDLGDDLVKRGNPEPTEIRPGLPPRADEPSAQGASYFETESWILKGGGHQYLALPQTEHLEIYHLLSAKLVRESDAELDVALLAINNFPHYESAPVLYMEAPEDISIGTRIVTSGCDCGTTEGISQGEVQGTVVSGATDCLTYESTLVSPGFSGGPVIMDDYVVAMNLTQDRTGESRIQARLASTFKDLVDDWIGLPRMQIDLVVDSPEGARDGVVSTDQGFTIRATARLDPGGQVLAPVTTVTLDLPDQYLTEDDAARVLAIGGDEQWKATSPSEVTNPLPVKILEGRVTSYSEPSLLAEMTISTEDGAHLKGILVDAPPEGGELFLRDDFTVAVKFEQSGHRVTDLEGEVTVDVARHQFEIVNGEASRSIVVGKPIEWRLRPQDVTEGASISFKADLQSLDRNGKPISIELPQPITVDINDSWSFRLYAGIGRLSFGGDMGLEFEIGTKYRLTNLMERGIPLNFVVAGGFGIDHASFEDISLCDVRDEALFIEYRYWLSTGLSVGFNPIEACIDLGYMWFNQHIFTEIPEECQGPLKVDPISGFYVQPGLELGIPYVGSIYGGLRMFSDIDKTEFLVQIRFRNER